MHYKNLSLMWIINIGKPCILLQIQANSYSDKVSFSSEIKKLQSIM